MAKFRQEERFGRVTGHTMRRSPRSNHYAEQFVIRKRIHTADFLVNNDDDDISRQFEELLYDGDLVGSSESGHVYSLNKRKRWELPDLLKKTICNDHLHQDLDFKVMLVEQHFDRQNVFHPACTGLYETQTSQAERLPQKKYAHAWDLHRRRDESDDQEEALRRLGNKMRCMKNRGGKKINWRGVMDAMRDQIQGEEQRRVEEAEEMPQIRYEVGYSRPENKYPWRPEMKLNTFTSKGPKATKQRHKASTMNFLEDTYNMDDIEDDIFEEVMYYSEVEPQVKEDTTDCSMFIHETRSMPTLEEAFIGLAKKSKTGRCKKRRHKSNLTTGHPEKKSVTNKATSNAVKKHDKGSLVYDPDAATYKSLLSRRHHRGDKATMATSSVHEEPVENLPSLSLLADQDSVNPSNLEADFGKAYTPAQCKPQRFAIEIGNDVAGSAGNPQDSVYALFEYRRENSTVVECKPIEEADECWQLVKKGVPLRMTVYGQSDGLNKSILISDMATRFPPTTVFSIKEFMTCLQDELMKSIGFLNKSQRKETRFNSRRISSDIPTVRAVFGWHCSFSTADEAYRDITNSQIYQSSNESNVEAVVRSDTCGICCETLAPCAVYGADVAAPSAGGIEGTVLTLCGHHFCNDCWHQYLRSGVEQRITNITCPEYNCKSLIDQVTAMSFLSPAQFHALYRHARDTTLAHSTQWHRCPNPRCGRIARVGMATDNADKAAMVIQCQCGWLWCTECKEEAHWPATCQQTKDYRVLVKKRLGEKENKDLITHVQVKHCPRCRTRWEKNGGCPSMICGMCQLNFCWMCLQPFDAHDVNSCRSGRANLEFIHLDYKTPSKEFMLEMAVEHHKQRFDSSMRKYWLAAARLASKSAMFKLSRQKQVKLHTSLQVTTDTMTTVSPSNNLLPVTWARTQEHLDIMSERAAQSVEIAAFCHESNFVLEHLAFLLGGTPRRQRKAKWRMAMLRLRFITQQLEETLRTLPNLKRLSSEATMVKLCNMMDAGKDCLRRLAQSMPSASKMKRPGGNNYNKE